MRKTRPPHLLRSLLLSLGALVGCSETKVLDELTVTPIGQSGGIATSADGLFAVEFPAGAVASTIDVQILTVRSLVPSGVIGPIYDLTDNSFAFGGAPLIRMSASEGAPGYEIVEIAGSGITVVEGSVEDELIRKVSAPFKRHARYARRRHSHPQPDAGGVADAGTSTPTIDGGMLDSGVNTGTTSRALCTSVSTLDFGMVSLGQQASREVSVRNCGLDDVTITSVYVQTSSSGFSVTDSSPTRLSSGQSTSITVVYAPRSGGPARGALLIEASGLAATVWLTGESGTSSGRCELFTDTGTCSVEVFGPTSFSAPTSSHDLEVRVDAGFTPTACPLGLRVEGLGFRGTLTSTLGGIPLPVELEVSELQPLTVQISFVATGSSAWTGAFRVTGRLGSECVVPLTVP